MPLWIWCLQQAVAFAQRIGNIRRATQIGQMKLRAVRRLHRGAA
jgi:hypothetical protein